MKLHIKNGRVIDPANGIDAVQDLYIVDGKDRRGRRRAGGFAAERTIDASGLVVAPGLVDLSARLREPGYEYKATLESEMQAAVQGGVTTLVCPPDTDPVLDEPGLVEMLKHRARLLNQAHVHPLGALTMGLKGKALTEMAELTEAGCIGFSQAEEPIEDTTVLLRAMQYAKTFGYTVWLRPQDAHIGRGGIAHSGPLASRLGLSGVPVMSETIALHTIFELMRASGARVHLCRISSAAGAGADPRGQEGRLAGHLRRRRAPPAHDRCRHRLLRPERAPDAAAAQPARPRRDPRRLLDGTIDAVCSDHTPVDDDEKLLPFAEASPGATGLELLLSLMLKWADEQGAACRGAGQDHARCRRAWPACRPARWPRRASADVVLFDPAARWTVKPSALASQGKHTPFLGYELTGQVQATIVAGHVAFQRAVKLR
jgi:dihydroorotase